MFTKRLYDENSYIREFDARVLSCEEGKNGYEVVLDESAFFPEGGGQPADQGFLCLRLCIPQALSGPNILQLPLKLRHIRLRLKELFLRIRIQNRILPSPGRIPFRAAFKL